MNSELGIEGLRSRLEYLIGNEKPFAWAKRVGIHSATFSRMWNEGVSPKADTLLYISEATGCSIDWLLTGKGTPYIEDTPLIIPSGNRSGVPDQGDFDYIPMVEASLSAGGGAFIESENVEGYYAFRKSWIKRVAASASDLVLMRVIGDSMSPTIQDRDTVMIDTARKQIKEGQIYAIRFDHTIMIKRLSFRPGGKIQVISDNKKDYEPYEATLADLHIIGQIIFFSRVFVPE